ncbi:MAG: histidine--tRNA ligase [Flavobacteriales bacterium]|nr:histidine--tRNA ligase [Flavobacteriales bacterium]
MSKPSTPQGTRDFLPAVMARRNYIFDTIRTVIQKYGYVEIQTPAMENLSTLTGKYGDEGDQLIFKILNSDDYLAKANVEALEAKDSKKLLSSISKRALRYDLTVPFARYVVQNQNDIIFPFKRFQIQPVWRADRPQKNRYREFYQCDVDVIGSDSLLLELEIIQILDEVFRDLKLNVVIKINNRKILRGLAQYIGVEDRMTDLVVAIDKIDKVGLEGVLKELSGKGFSADELKKVDELLSTDSDDLARITSLVESSEEGRKGLEEVNYVIDGSNEQGLKSAKIEFDFSLARGLNYYTGTIIEVVGEDFPVSIGGGGRYDDLTGVFGLKDMSGIGVSFGADRIYNLLEDKGLFPEKLGVSTQIMFVNLGDAEAKYCLGLVAELRANGISCELYPDSAKMKKQMKYADGKNVELVAIVGETEMGHINRMVKVKNMTTGDQVTQTFKKLISDLKQ